MNILSVQINQACTRNYKYARLLKSKGHKVHCIYKAGADPREYYNLSDSPYETVDVMPFSVNITHWVDKYDIDAIHFHNRPEMPLSLLTPAQIPIVYDIHDPPFPDEKLDSVAEVQYICVSQELAKDLNIPALIIPNFALQEELYNKPRKDKLPGIHAVYVGSFYNWKSSLEIMNEINTLSHIHPQIQFHIYCSSGLEKEIMSISSDRIQFHPAVPPDRLYDEISKYTFGIIAGHQSTMAQHAAPNKMTDYLAAGLPVVFNKEFLSVHKLLIQTPLQPVGYQYQSGRPLVLEEILQLKDNLQPRNLQHLSLEYYYPQLLRAYYGYR